MCFAGFRVEAMNPQLRNFLVFGIAIGLSVWIGGQVATESYLVPSLAFFACIAAIAARKLR